MKKNCVWCLLFLLPLMMLPTITHAQTFGKIAGRVLDSESGEPLLGAAVVVEGTRLGASTDLDGNFIILRVPPGSYTLEASFLGYSTTRVQEVEVNIDLTTRLDVILTPQALAAAEEVVVVAERPLVRRDQTSMESRVGSKEMDRMPVQNLADVIDVQPGVVRGGDGGLHIRGGRSSEVSYLMNGISITDDYDKSQAMDVMNEAVAELQIISGAFNAEYGNAMSGVINVVTKGGSNQFHGSVQMEAGDYYSGRTELFPHLDDVSPSSNNNQTFTLSGPILKDKLTFFASGRRSQSEGWMYGERWYRPQGRGTINGDGEVVAAYGDSAVVPLNDWEHLNGQGVLQWTVTDQLLVKADLLANGGSSRGYNHDNKYNPDGTGYTDTWGRTGILKLTWLFSENTFAEASFADRENNSSYSLYDNPHDARYAHPDSAIYGSYSFAQGGTDLSVFERTTISRIGKLDLTSQVNDRHQVKTGLEVQLDRVDYDDITLIPAKDENGQELVPFQTSIPKPSEQNRSKYSRTPYKFAAYMQDKIEYKSVVINVGLRFDLFDPQGKLPVDPQDPNIYRPLKLANQYHDSNGDGVIDLSEQTEDNQLTVADRRSYWYKDTSVKTQVSPRLGVAYPITDRGIIHFSYGIFQQIPEYSLLYGDDERKVAESADVYGPFGNPDLEPQRTTMYELGLSQQLTDQFAINLTGFYRDIRDWISAGAQIPTSVAGISYVTYTNRDLANVRGITFGVEGRFTDRIQLFGDYTYQVAEGTNSSPEDEYWSQIDGDEPTKQLTPLNWDQRHTLNLNAFYGTAEYGVTLLASYNSGQPYTPEILTGERTGRSIIAGLSDNSRRMPNRFNLDLYAFRAIPVWSTRIRLSLEVRNLLDGKNPTAVFNDTGQADYTVNEELVQDADEGYFVRPDYYAEPRSILFGVRYEF
ncbi:TonB-dependent receptor [bacterium]|nr:TonB-dependent receptor [bacterium]